MCGKGGSIYSGFSTNHCNIALFIFKQDHTKWLFGKTEQPCSSGYQ